MKKIITTLFLSLFSLINQNQLLANNGFSYPKGFSEQKNSTISFLENKGQVHDQNNKPRPDVLFSGVSEGMVFHLRNNGVSYQLSKLDSVRIENSSPVTKTTDKLKKGIYNTNELSKYTTSTVYRLDINWLNINANSRVAKGKALEGFNNYYSENCPNGALNVKSFEDVTYINIYNGIDLKWYQQSGQLKYDYMVGIGADYRQIQFEINGALDISINAKGELELKTPLGIIIEHAPLVTQHGKTLPSSWKINKNKVSFDIQNINPNQSFIIDPPVRTWGTYYGGSGADFGIYCAADAAGNVYLTGNTFSSGGTSIATVGSHQTVNGGGSADGFLVKFNSAGVRQWGTYYGDSGNDFGNSCCTDASGNVYMAGTTDSPSGIAVGGFYNFYTCAITAAFLVKFNSAGVRQWATYYGDVQKLSRGNSCATDASGNVFLAGATAGPFSLATPGSHQPSYAGLVDAFLVKFNPAGARLWATYYGGSSFDEGYSCATDLSGNVFLAGTTFSDSDIATPGSFDPTYLYNNGAAFLVKFNSAGVRQWGTYWQSAGSSNETTEGYCCATDAAGNVYVSGMTDDISTLAFGACHQCSQIGGGLDAILGKFNSAGAGLWGTYYGGFGQEYGYSCFTDVASNVYMVGETSSASFISTPSGHQPSKGGGGPLVPDGFLVQFDATGTRLWGTYYGGTTADAGKSGCVDASGRIYLAGNTLGAAANVISTAGSHQVAYTGGSNGAAFLVQFYDVTITLPVELIEFNGVIKNETVLLNWATQSESNNKLFEIEKSVDGINFIKIGEVKGNGNSRTLAAYNFTDENPLNAINYYRLKQIDNNGSSKNSNVIQISFNKEVTSFYPNPASDYLVFKTKNKSQKVSIKNLFGFELINKLISSDDYILDLNGFSEGFYIVTIDGENRSLIIKK